MRRTSSGEDRVPAGETGSLGGETGSLGWGEMGYLGWEDGVPEWREMGSLGRRTGSLGRHGVPGSGGTVQGIQTGGGSLGRTMPEGLPKAAAGG